MANDNQDPLSFANFNISKKNPRESSTDPVSHNLPYNINPFSTPIEELIADLELDFEPDNPQEIEEEIKKNVSSTNLSEDYIPDSLPNDPKSKKAKTDILSIYNLSEDKDLEDNDLASNDPLQLSINQQLAKKERAHIQQEDFPTKNLKKSSTPHLESEESYLEDAKHTYTPSKEPSNSSEQDSELPENFFSIDENFFPQNLSTSPTINNHDTAIFDSKDLDYSSLNDSEISNTNDLPTEDAEELFSDLNFSDISSNSLENSSSSARINNNFNNSQKSSVSSKSKKLNPIDSDYDWLADLTQSTQPNTSTKKPIYSNPESLDSSPIKSEDIDISQTILNDPAQLNTDDNSTHDTEILQSDNKEELDHDAMLSELFNSVEAPDKHKKTNRRTKKSLNIDLENLLATKAKDTQTNKNDEEFLAELDGKTNTNTIDSDTEHIEKLQNTNEFVDADTINSSVPSSQNIDPINSSETSNNELDTELLAQISSTPDSNSVDPINERSTRKLNDFSQNLAQSVENSNTEAVSASEAEVNHQDVAMNPADVFANMDNIDVSDIQVDLSEGEPTESGADALSTPVSNESPAPQDPSASEAKLDKPTNSLRSIIFSLIRKPLSIITSKGKKFFLSLKDFIGWQENWWLYFDILAAIISTASLAIILAYFLWYR